MISPMSHRIQIVLDSGGRHEMLNEINRAEVLNNLFGWLAGLAEKQEVSPNQRKLA